LKGRDDTSAEERYINRSMKIRKGVKAWMFDNLGVLFESWEEMAGLAGNYCAQKKYTKEPASSVACRRWIYQFSLPGAPFHIRGEPSGYVIADREDMESRPRTEEHAEMMER
jgi:hypothetical protein